MPGHLLAESLGTEKSYFGRMCFQHPNQQRSEHAQKNICMTLEKTFIIITPDGRKVPRKSNGTKYCSKISSYFEVRNLYNQKNKTIFCLNYVLHPQQLNDTCCELIAS